MRSKNKKPKPGDRVVLVKLPPGLIEGLPMGDQRPISDIVGKPILLEEYREDGKAELAFKSDDGTFHSIWVDPNYIKAAKWCGLGVDNATRARSASR
jgi:hypothetical protein